MKQDIDQLFQQASHLQEEGQIEQAIKTYEALLCLEPKHADALHFLALAQVHLGNIPQALHYIQEALAVRPEAALYNHLGILQKKLGQQQEAVLAYQQALACDPEYAPAHNNLATLYVAQAKVQDALEHYARAVHAQPDFVLAHFNLGLLFIREQQFSPAQVQFNNVLTLCPEHREARFHVANLLLHEDKLDEAADHLQELLTYDPEHTEALVNLGVISLKKEMQQQAVDYFTRALALNNAHHEARNNLAATFMHYDRYELALTHYQELLAENPHHPEYLYNSGVAQMALGHLAEGISAFERLLEIEPKHHAALSNLAAIYLRMDSRATAQHYLEEALRINPQDVISQHMLHALSGEPAGESVPEYARTLFNNYSLYYDQHMQGTLKYSLPHHMGRLLHQRELFNIPHTLDLGCGTGLTGVVLRELSLQLTGVDIAEKMLDRAREKGIYDHLVHEELIHYLQHREDCYQLIVAADVLPYLGELSMFFALLEDRVAPEGYVLLSAEISVQSPWQLQASARFSHQPAYLHDLFSSHHFELCQEIRVPARLQQGTELELMIYFLRKNKAI